MDLTYFGTATIRIATARAAVMTDPAFDPAGTSYDFGPWYTPRAWLSSEKQYETPAAPERIDAFLITHDHHADNMDDAGRALVAARGVPVVTTVAGARRLARAAPAGRGSRAGEGLGLGDRARGLAVGASTEACGLTITATPARHGPRGTPQVNQVIGFVVASPGEPTVWISGDTVLHAPLRAAIAALRDAGTRIDVAVVHCGGVCFPRMPILGKRLFTFDAAQAVETIGLLDPGLVVPVHRAGWTHFRQPEADLRAAFDAAGFGPRTRFLDVGETIAI
jgi:L-ascorbate metabolism protein UlaG (beta-lactamase superfamily)